MLSAKGSFLELYFPKQTSLIHVWLGCLSWEMSEKAIL